MRLQDTLKANDDVVTISPEEGATFLYLTTDYIPPCGPPVPAALQKRGDIVNNSIEARQLQQPDVQLPQQQPNLWYDRSRPAGVGGGGPSPIGRDGFVSIVQSFIGDLERNLTRGIVENIAAEYELGTMITDLVPNDRRYAVRITWANPNHRAWDPALGGLSTIPVAFRAPAPADAPTLMEYVFESTSLHGLNRGTVLNPRAGVLLDWRILDRTPSPDTDITNAQQAPQRAPGTTNFNAPVVQPPPAPAPPTPMGSNATLPLPSLDLGDAFKQGVYQLVGLIIFVLMISGK